MSLEDFKKLKSHIKILGTLAAFLSAFLNHLEKSKAFPEMQLNLEAVSGFAEKESNTKKEIPFTLLRALMSRESSVLLDMALRDLLRDKEALDYLIMHLSSESNRELLDRAYEIDVSLHRRILHELDFFNKDLSERLGILMHFPNSLFFYTLTIDKELRDYILSENSSILYKRLEEDKNGSVFIFLVRELTIIDSEESIVESLSKDDSFITGSIKSLRKSSKHAFWKFMTYINTLRFYQNKSLRDFAEKYLSLLKQDLNTLKQYTYETSPYKMDTAFLEFLKGNFPNSEVRQITGEIFMSLEDDVILGLLQDDENFVSNLNYFHPKLQNKVWSIITPDILERILQKNGKFAGVFMEALLSPSNNEVHKNVKKLFFSLNSRQVLIFLKNADSSYFWDFLMEEEFLNKVRDVLGKLTLDDIKSKLSFSNYFLRNVYDLSTKRKQVNGDVLHFFNNTLDGIIASKDYNILGSDSSSLNFLIWKEEFWKKRLGKDFYLRVLISAAVNSPLLAAENIEKKNYHNEEIKEALLRGIVRYVSHNFSEQQHKNKMHNYNILMRIINHLHAPEHTKWRQVILKNMSALHRYWLSIYGVSEVFTSTSSYVNYILPIIFEDIRLSKGGVDVYLKKVDPDLSGLGTFILVIARYNKLDEFLAISKLDNPNYLLKQLLNGKISVDNAQAIVKLLFYVGSSDKYSKHLKSMELELYKSFKKAENNSDTILARKLSSLASLYWHAFSAKSLTKDPELLAWFAESVRKENVLIPDKLHAQDLFDMEGGNFVHRQVWFFFEGGDKDGIKSRWSAAAHLKKAGFEKIKTVRSKTQQTADDSLLVYRKKEGNKIVELWLSPIIRIDDLKMSYDLSKVLSGDLLELLQAGKVKGLAYRGHSTYVPDMAALLKKIKIPKSSRINFFNLGSCGGASSIELLSGALPMPISAWIATESTGSSDINDKIFVSLLEEIVKLDPDDGDILDFIEFEKKLRRHFAGNKLYHSYKMPYSNFPAILNFHFRKIEKSNF